MTYGFNWERWGIIKCLFLWPFILTSIACEEIAEWFDGDDGWNTIPIWISVPFLIFATVIGLVGFVINMCFIWFTFWFALAKQIYLKKKEKEE